MSHPHLAHGPGSSSTTRPSVSTTDLVVTLVVVLALLPVVLLVGFMLLGFTTMGTTACGPGECETFGVVLGAGFVAVPAVGLVGAGVALVQLWRRRRAWPWAAAGTALAAVIPFAVLVVSFFVID